MTYIFQAPRRSATSDAAASRYAPLAERADEGGETVRDFSAAVRRFVAAFGTTPPASTYDFHPAHHPLSVALRQATRFRFRESRPFQRMWAAEVACHMLRDLVLVDGKLTEGGVTAEQLRSDVAGWGPPLNPHYCNRSTVLLMIELLDDAEPALAGPLRDAWHAVRQCPPPPIELFREGPVTW